MAESNKYNDREGGGYRGRGRGGYGARGGFNGGRGGGRGGGGRNMGPRGDRDRGNRGGYSSRQPQDQHQEVDTWDNSYAQTVEQPAAQQADEWGDWDNEEYVGSLKDTKVFTPSNMQTTASVVASSIVSGDIGAPPGLGDHQQQSDDILQQSQQYSQQVVSSNSVLNSSQFPEIHSSNVSTSASIPQVKSSATLSAEQSQYFNSLTSQNAQAHLHQQQQQQAQVHASVQYPTTYGTVFGDPSAVSSQPRRTRAKVPPPSKIPSSAVEMPGDMLNNATYLEDVQFGFGIEDSAFVEALSDKFASATAIAESQQSNVQSLQQNQQAADLSGNEYQTKQIQNSKIVSFFSLLNFCFFLNIIYFVV